jgi:hypothetical protein
MEERMLKTNQDLLRAVLTTALSYEKDGETIVVPAGVEVMVDPKQGIALVSGDPVYVDLEDYRVLVDIFH